MLLALATTALGQVKADSKPAAAPAINTAKLWRLLATAQGARFAASQTREAKQAEAADEEVRKEQAILADKCGAGFVLGYQQDPKAENAGDIICVKAPEPKPEPKKEK